MIRILYATKGNIVAIIAKDYEHSRIITRVYDCSAEKPKLKIESERKSIINAKDYLHNKYQLEDFNCMWPITYVQEGVKKEFLERVKQDCEDLIKDF
ncbi:MAG: hypothetical protein L6408_07785 [Nanoarchaeota archaeon]|nr:hypothetical protein [Nanoarchaeota archaeon]